MNIFTNSEYTHVENGMVIVKSCSKPSKKNDVHFVYPVA